jgi:superfamily II DNA or RNA helicase
MSITRRGYVINKDNITSEELMELKEELYITPNIPEEFSQDIKPYALYHENEKTITIPRYFGIEKVGKLKLSEQLKNFQSIKTKFKFNGELRQAQQEIVDEVLPKIKKQGGGIISVPCGEGKTVMAIKIAHLLGLKTLVLVHKTFLQDQWVARVKQFTNARIGTIRQSTIDIEDKDIVIGMIQSISKRKYDMNIFDQFGFVIVDECHHIASRVFSRTLYKAGANYTLGLSATPKRTDGLTRVLHWYLGKMLFVKERKQNNNVIVRKFNMSLTDPLFIEQTLWFKKKRVVSIPKMINNLIKIQRRNQLIIDTINALRVNSNRKILVLSGRIEHLEFLKKKVDESIQNDIDTGKLLEDDCKTCYYIGKLKSDERKDAEKNGDILFASYEMAQEGLDIDRLNTIILATPKKDVVQAIGRIMRRILTKTDLKPLIVDLTDDLSIFTKQGKIRHTLYSKNNYIIKEIMIDDNYQVPVSKYYQANQQILQTDNIPLSTIFNEEILDDPICDEKKPEQVQRCVASTDFDWVFND